jgi:hypothetical protein
MHQICTQNEKVTKICYKVQTNPCTELQRSIENTLICSKDSTKNKRKKILLEQARSRRILSDLALLWALARSHRSSGRRRPMLEVGAGRLMSTHASILVDSVGPPSAEVCRAAASFP